MANPTYFTFSEHSLQNEDDENRLTTILAENISKYKFSNDNPEYLGLNDKLEAHYYIGMRWIKWNGNDKEHKGVIWVKPKNSDIPFEKLLLACLTHPIVSNHLNECYKVNIDEPSIVVPHNFSDYLTPLLIADFLMKARNIVKRGLKKNYVSIRETLNNKTKGKISVNTTIKNQLKKGIITQTDCVYQIHTVDCLENRILKTALLQSQKYIYQFLKTNNQLRELLLFNLTAFEHVSTVSVNRIDLSEMHHNIFYKDYKGALHLAKLILDRIGYSLNADITKKAKTIPPFYINMPELFERYCEVLLRKKYPDTLAGYHQTGYSETRLGRSRLRPDFIIPSENRIVDSKYKYWIEGSNDIHGLMQLSLYSRHDKALQFLNNESKNPILQIIYPSKDGDYEIDFSKSMNQSIEEYEEIYKYPVMINEI